MAAKICGSALSSIFLDNLNRDGNQEGFLLGQSISVVTNTISDAQMTIRKEETTMCIQSFIPCRQTFTFYDDSGQVLENRLSVLLGDKVKEVVGWYKFRRNSSFQLSMREKAVHKNLMTVFPSRHKEQFLFFLITACDLPQSTLDHACYHMVDGATRAINVQVINLGDTSTSVYRRQPVTGGSLSDQRIYDSVLHQYRSLFLANDNTSNNVAQIRDFNRCLNQKLKSLCSGVSVTEEQISLLALDIRALTLRRRHLEDKRQRQEHERQEREMAEKRRQEHARREEEEREQLKRLIAERMEAVRLKEERDRQRQRELEIQKREEEKERIREELQAKKEEYDRIAREEVRRIENEEFLRAESEEKRIEIEEKKRLELLKQMEIENKRLADKDDYKRRANNGRNYRMEPNNINVEETQKRTWASGSDYDRAPSPTDQRSPFVRVGVRRPPSGYSIPLQLEHKLLAKPDISRPMVEPQQREASGRGADHFEFVSDLMHQHTPTRTSAPVISGSSHGGPSHSGSSHGGPSHSGSSVGGASGYSAPPVHNGSRAQVHTTKDRHVKYPPPSLDKPAMPVRSTSPTY